MAAGRVSAAVMTRYSLLGSALLLGGTGSIARAQSTGIELHATVSSSPQMSAASRAALDSLAAASARLTLRYQDRRAAVADGYRRLGTDFPGMGEHWLHPGTLLTGRIDAARPTLLTYATVDGQSMLLALGFVVTTRGDSLANTTPGWPDVWHEHSGLFADESGARASALQQSANATRVWVLHVWTMLENPAGRYAPDNWALPFRRAGLAARPGVDANVGRAFALAFGGDEYLRGVLSDAGLRNDANGNAVDAAIAAARATAVTIAERAHVAKEVRDEDTTSLRDLWKGLSESLRA
ncbi:MAG: hypothetical protein ABIW79_10715, partial [Gemmatimonas sp.]